MVLLSYLSIIFTDQYNSYKYLLAKGIKTTVKRKQFTDK